MNRPRCVSLFSGCGGSCLGFKLAGFDVIWANEFVDQARADYVANNPNVIVDPRDIRAITPEQIMEVCNLAPGELDVLEGSPPCSAFSVAGVRDKGWGKVKNYSDRKQRVDDLFFEYARILKGLQPKAFVAENVPGLTIGKAKRIYAEVFRTLERCGYVVEARVIRASALGVPQNRDRLIFVGVRKDLDLRPAFPKPRKKLKTFGEAIKGLTDPGTSHPLKPEQKCLWLYKLARPGEAFDEGLARKIGKPRGTKHFTHFRLAFNRPCPTVLASAMTHYHPTEPRTLGINELKRVCSFPDNFKLSGSLKQQWERLGRAVPPLMMKAIAETVRRDILELI